MTREAGAPGDGCDDKPSKKPHEGRGAICVMAAKTNHPSAVDNTAAINRCIGRSGECFLVAFAARCVRAGGFELFELGLEQRLQSGAVFAFEGAQFRNPSF